MSAAAQAGDGEMKKGPSAHDVEVTARSGLAEPIVRAKVAAGSDVSSTADCSNDDVFLRNVVMHDYGETVLGLTPTRARRRQMGWRRIYEVRHGPGEGRKDLAEDERKHQDPGCDSQMEMGLFDTAWERAMAAQAFHFQMEEVTKASDEALVAIYDAGLAEKFKDSSKKRAKADQVDEQQG